VCGVKNSLFAVDLSFSRNDYVSAYKDHVNIVWLQWAKRWPTDILAKLTQSTV